MALVCFIFPLQNAVHYVIFIQMAISLMEVQVAVSANLRKVILVRHGFKVASRLQQLRKLVFSGVSTSSLCCSFVVECCLLLVNIKGDII